MDRKRASIVAAMTVAAVVMATAPGRTAGVIAVIVDYGPGATISGDRNGKAATFALGTVLEAGDRLVIPDDGFVRIDRGGNCEFITGASFAPTDPGTCTSHLASSYVMLPQGMADSASARFRELAEVLNWWDPKRPRKPMRSRDSYRPRVPALDGVDRPLLAEGERVLQVRWVDGKPPFQLSAVTGDGRVVTGVILEKERRATIKLSVRSGEMIRLELKAGNQAKTYELLGTRDLLVKGDAAGEYDRASMILSAISKSGGDFAFEGSQQIAALQLPSRIKQALMDAIQFGDWP